MLSKVFQSPVKSVIQGVSHAMRLAHPAVAALVAAGILFPGAAQALGLGLQPTRVEIEISPGETYRQILEVGNISTTRAMDLTIGLADWELTETGQLALAPPGSQKDSGAQWFRFSPARFIIKPGQRREVVVEISTPANLPPVAEYEVAVLATTVAPDHKKPRKGVVAEYQMASLFYLTVGDAEGDVSFGPAKLRKGLKGLEFHVNVTNSGAAHSRLNGVLRLFGKADQELATQRVEVVVLGGGKRRLIRTIPASAWQGYKGALRARLELVDVFAHGRESDKERDPFIVEAGITP